jgi:uncharacterized Tic20 family protein
MSRNFLRYQPPEDDLPIEVRNRAMLLHLTGSIAILCEVIIFGVLHQVIRDSWLLLVVVFSIPLVCSYCSWRAFQDEHLFIDENGCNAVNFLISILVYMVIATLLIAMLGLSLCGKSSAALAFVFVVATLFFSFLNPSFLYIAASIYGAFKARNGQVYRYPFAIEFLKPKHRAND